MKTRKPREENLSSGTIDEKKEKKQAKKNRLAGMLEAMEKRSDPITTHKLATEYFKSFREIRNLSPSPTSKRENKEEESNQSNTELTTPVVTPVTTPVATTVVTTVKTPVPTPVIEPETTAKRLTNKDESMEPLDTTHSSSETRIYSVMYRETISKGTDKQYFGTKRLMTLTGIRGDHTIRRAIDGLIAKKSIEIIDINFGHPVGPKYKVYAPKDIFQRRRGAGIEIDPQTKKIITPVATPVETHVNLTGVTPVKTTPVTPVKMTGVQTTIPYIEKNNKNIDIESSSSKIPDDESFNHKTYISSLYKKYTGNNWREEDEDFYNQVKDVLPDVIAAALIATTLRGNTISSFAECDGTIKEFLVKLPPGYLGYLRTQGNKTNTGPENNEGVQNTTQSKKNEPTVALSLPENSFFEGPWLENYLSDFSGDEQQRIKRLAEQFDYFMLTSGKRRDWVKNPTGFFVQLVKDEVNIKLPKDAPTFEERLKEEIKIKLESENEERQEKIAEEIRQAISLLKGEKRDKFLNGARKRYSFLRGGSDEYVIESVPYSIISELEEKEKQDWKEILGKINGSD